MGNKQIRVALAEVTIKKLDKICQEKGLNRASVVTVAIDKLSKEEETEGK